MQTDSGELRIVRAPMFAGTAPPVKEKLKCPRCESHNTKFCYFNNYNLAQPRHYCKECKRYWTQGGTLRNVPVGGGHRKYSQKRSYKPSKSTNNNNNNNNNNSPASSSSTPPSTPPSQQAITAYPISSRPRPSPATTGRSYTDGYIQGFTTFFNTVQAYGFMGYNGFEFEQLSPLPLGLPDTPETVRTGGDYSTGASAWQLGTGSDAGYGADNYCTWPELSISSTPRKGVM